MDEIAVVLRRFGDEQSTLLDQFERLSFEVQLNQAILRRSFSEPGAVSRSSQAQALPTLMPLVVKSSHHHHHHHQSQKKRQGRRGGSSVSEDKKDGSLDFAENPRGLLANKFMGGIKTLTSKERIGIFTSIVKDNSRRRNWTISEFNDLLMSLVTANEQEIALNLYCLMGWLGTRLLDIFDHGQVGRVAAFEMLVDIEKNDDAMKPDMHTYTAVTDGFCKGGRSSEAMGLLNEAVERGLRPSVVTFNTLFNGYCKEGMAMEGFSVLRFMKERNCVPDHISYSTLLYWLLRWGETRAALRVFKEMVGFGFEGDERMVNTLLRGLCIKSCKEKHVLEDAYQMF
ncbi:hypothetical protein ACOSQ2_028142 [Xanthoceras sorbifolium]